MFPMELELWEELEEGASQAPLLPPEETARVFSALSAIALFTEPWKNSLQGSHFDPWRNAKREVRFSPKTGEEAIPRAPTPATGLEPPEEEITDKIPTVREGLHCLALRLLE